MGITAIFDTGHQLPRKHAPLDKRNDHEPEPMIKIIDNRQGLIEIKMG